MTAVDVAHEGSPTADARALTRRLLDLVERGTTELADGPMEVPVGRYLDPARWGAERAAIFERVPLVFALGGELPAPGDYKAMDVMGTPVLLTRGPDGVVRGFLDVCRHRGAVVTPMGCGHARRHTCPYHAWSYDTEGSLVGLPGAEGFVGIDRAERGLRPLPVVERAGVVFGQTTPGLVLDLDGWLSGFDALLEPLGIESWRPVATNVLPGPNWKVCYDGYLEGYHFGSLHRTTLHTQIMSNVMAFDAYGHHQRVVFPRQGIVDACAGPEEGWDADAAVSVLLTFFPHAAMVVSREGCFLSQLWPGPGVGESTTVQTMFRATDCDPDDAAGARRQAAWLASVVAEEDYAIGFGLQAALASGAAAKAGSTFVFGANELGNQRFHRSVDAMLAAGTRLA